MQVSKEMVSYNQQNYFQDIVSVNRQNLGFVEVQQTDAHFEAFKSKMKSVFMALTKRNQELAELLEASESQNRKDSLLKDATITNLNERVKQLEALVAAKDTQIAQITAKSAADLKASIAERAVAVQTATKNTQQAANAQLASVNAQLSSVSSQLAAARLGRTYLTNLVNSIQGVLNALNGDINWYAARGEGNGVQVPAHGWNAYMAVNHIKAQIVSLSTTANSYLSQLR